MKKLLALLIVAVFASSAIAAEPAKKPTAEKKAEKKEVKKHKKAEGTKVPEPAKKK
jgi:Na+-transporting methylmalonyl-CoA/oxaloacetate decarboxylase gamma subunit